MNDIYDRSFPPSTPPSSRKKTECIITNNIEPFQLEGGGATMTRIFGIWETLGPSITMRSERTCIHAFCYIFESSALRPII